MNERIVQFRVGVMVLATFIIAGILILLFGKFPSFVKGTYTIYVRFPSAPGVAKETPVRRSGILIGRVTDVAIDDATDEVVVTLEIDGDRKIRQNDSIRITTTLLGDAQIEVVRLPAQEPSPSPPSDAKRTAAEEGATYPIADEAPPPPASDAAIPPGATVQGQVSVNPLDSFNDLKDDFARTARSLETAGNEVGKLSKNLNGLFDRNSQQFDRIINQTETALQSFQRAMQTVDDILGDDETKANLKKTLADLPLLLKDTQGAISGIDKAMRLVDKNLRNLEGFTEPLGSRGNQIVGNIDSSIARLNDLLGQVEQFSRALNSKEGSLGQLLNNPDIYQQLNEAVANINQITRRLRPIVEDARIITDKLARHPGSIVRDAVKPGSGTKWVTEDDLEGRKHR